MSATLDRLADANPNIGEHLRDWQIARTQNNEDAYDWKAFCDHELAIGAPDPGSDEPDEFRQYDWTKYAPSAQQDYSASTSSSSSGSSSSGSSSGSGAAVSNASAGVTEPPQQAKKSLFDFIGNMNPFRRR